MRSDLDAFLDEGPPRGLAVQKVRDLSLATKVMLASAVLLFFSLFLTWQNLEIVYRGAGTGTQMLDGWDVFGLLVGFLTVGLLTYVVVVKLYDPELGSDSTEFVAVLLATAICGLVVAKNLTDRNSAWASYFALGLAVIVVVAALLDWIGYRIERSAVPGRRRRRIRAGF